MTIKTNQSWRGHRLFSMLLLLLASLELTTTNLMAETSSRVGSSERKTYLSISPERCVALREGQVCYQNVVLKWQTKHKGNFCLYLEGATISQRCWSQSDQGQYEMDFQSDKSRRFVLRAKDTSTELAGADMIVAWVYGNKKRRRASWRLF